MFNQKERETAKQICRTLFKNIQGNPFELSDGQADIFLSVYLKRYNRIQIIAPTQYGKSTAISMGIICRSQAFREPIAIVTGSQPKSDVIMGEVIQHTFDNSAISSQLDLDKKEPLERIKRERSKKRLTWKGGGEVKTFTADSRNRRRVLDSLMGFGSPFLIEDESALIPDDLQVMVLRMLGGHQGGTLIKIGNPSYRNHFHRTWHSPMYKKIFIDYNQALREGRYTQEFMDEMLNEPYFNILYGCKFPEANEIDALGYRKLYNIEEIKRDGKHSGKLRLGFDVAEGVDENIGVLRSDTYAEIVHRSKTSDLMQTAREIAKLIDKYEIEPHNVMIDRIGVGAGVYSKLKEDYNVTGVKWSEKSNDEKYMNIKAEHFFKSQKWFKEGSFSGDDGWGQLDLIKWKEDTSGRFKIKGKEEMRKEGIRSPDVADAFALSFHEPLIPSIHII